MYKRILLAYDGSVEGRRTPGRRSARTAMRRQGSFSYPC